MSKNVFVSYKFQEKNWKDNFLQLFQGFGGKAQATPLYIDLDTIPTPTNEQIKAKISGMLQSSVGLLVVIGNNSQHSDWVEHEVGVAGELKLKRAYTRHPQATGGVPQIIADGEKAKENPIRRLDWSQEAIAAWVATL